jgi:putative Mg2+ transporter-C (MgtC) family protein
MELLDDPVVLPSNHVGHSCRFFQVPQRDLLMWIGQLAGQGWIQVGELGLAFALSALIGLEREIRHKSAGLRTYTLVGFAAALMMLVSKYGFTNILAPNQVVLDPSRIAAQIVTGIGFIGGGLIFVRRDSVRGLTTAATVWLTAAVGMACGAGLPILALVVTAGHFIVIAVFPVLVARVPSSRWSPSWLRVSYEDRGETLLAILAACTGHDFAVSRIRVERGAGEIKDGDDAENVLDDNQAGLHSRTAQVVTVALEVQGTRSIAKLVARLTGMAGVVSVNAADANVPSD